MKVEFIGNLRGSPDWLADFGTRDHLSVYPAKADPAQFTDQAGIPVALTASASQNATSIAVTALSPGVLANTTLIAQGGVVIPSGSIIDFGGAKVARVAADARIGDTAITVAALPTALAGTETATFSRYGTIYLPSGTFLGRTFAERDANTAFGPASVTDDEFGLTYVDVADLHLSGDVTLVRPGSGTTVKENYLPQYAAFTAAANEVQTVAVDTIVSGGAIGITAAKNDGTEQNVLVAYDTSWTTTVAAIQTALNALLGTSAVAAAVAATKNMTLTFSGTGYANTPQPLVGVDISAATGPTKATVSRSTPSGAATLNKLRTLYNCIKGVG